MFFVAKCNEAILLVLPEEKYTLPNYLTCKETIVCPVFIFVYSVIFSLNVHSISYFFVTTARCSRRTSFLSMVHPANPPTYSFWVRCGATSICDGIFVVVSVLFFYHGRVLFLLYLCCICYHICVVFVSWLNADEPVTCVSNHGDNCGNLMFP